MIRAAGNSLGWWAAYCLITPLLALGITQARGQPVAELAHFTEVFYSSGPLRSSLSVPGLPEMGHFRW